jgi:hypothetical protein
MKTRLVNGFLWLLVTDKAKEIFNSGIFELFTLHDDGYESLIDSFEDLNKALEDGNDIAIEVNHIENI